MLGLGYRTEPNLSKYFVQTHGKDQAQAQAQAQTRVRVRVRVRVMVWVRLGFG